MSAIPPLERRTAPDAEDQAQRAERESREKAIIDKKLAFETQRTADYTDRLARLTLLLFCAAVGQIALFWVQLRYMRVGTKDTGIAAGAAQTSADIARLSMVAGDRAYVHHNGCRWISHRNSRDGHIFWRIRPRWINSGNMPFLSTPGRSQFRPPSRLREKFSLTISIFLEATLSIFETGKSISMFGEWRGIETYSLQLSSTLPNSVLLPAA
jgi:hypothetical protein